jgi:hypothetical protein
VKWNSLHRTPEAGVTNTGLDLSEILEYASTTGQPTGQRKETKNLDYLLALI